MRVVGAHHLEPRRARAADGGEMIGRLHLKLRRALPQIARAHHVLHQLERPDEEAAALVRLLFQRMGDDAVEGGLADLHADYDIAMHRMILTAAAGALLAAAVPQAQLASSAASAAP